MTMDFSQLHTYTPPQCAPDNTGYTYSLSSSYSTAALEFEQEHQIDPVYDSPRMIRKSLRLRSRTTHHGDENQVDYSQNNSSSHTSTTRVLRSRQAPQTPSSAVTLSLSQSVTPRNTLSFSATSTPNNNISNFQENSRETDAYQLTPALHHSHQRQRTVTTRSADGQWDQSAIQNSSSVNGAGACKSHASHISGYICKDCCKKKDFLIVQSSSQPTSSSHAAESGTDFLSSSSSPFTSIYTRDRSRKKSSFLGTVSNRCVHYSKRILASTMCFLTTIFNSVVWMGSEVKSRCSKGTFASFMDTVRRAASSNVSHLWVLKQNTLHRMMGHRANGYEGQAHSSFCGSMNVKELMNEAESHLNLNGSLCDDCKGKQYSQTRSVLLKQSSGSSRSHRLVHTLWSVLVLAGEYLRRASYCLVSAGKALGSGIESAAQSSLEVLWMLVATPVVAGRQCLWLLATGWYQLVYLMSVLNVFFLTRCIPKLWKLLCLLLPLLLLLALWLWGPSIGVLLVNLTRSHSSTVPVPPSEIKIDSTPATPISQPPPIFPPGKPSEVDLERLERVEGQLVLLWEQFQQGDKKEERHHGELLGLYGNLKEQLHTQTDKESLGVWVSALLERRLGLLRGELDQENTLKAQSAEDRLLQGQAAQLGDFKLLLQTLSVKTEEVQQKQEQLELKAQQQKVVTPSEDTVSVGVNQEDHEALLAEVQRLEVELVKIRHDLQGVLGCKGKCEQLDTLQETISSQVTSQMRKELKAVFFGNAESEEEIPESLIFWLSQRYVSTPDLQASLASLEMNLLRNISLQLEQSQAQTMNGATNLVQTLTQTVHPTFTGEGLSEEHVKLIVQNALKLYSQDRIGMVDYALESGGGSILSTRCSETYRTNTALMSLFGVPMWYYSQSPRAVIQPDVYPGNCWAFKGSQGYLVIRLSMSILPTSFSLEHIPKSLAPTGKITSAPRNLSVFGLDDEYQEEGKLLGQYTYRDDGESLQTFDVQEPNDKAFQIIEVRVLSNWGHPEYTCLYRFRVHGKLHPQ